MRSSAYEKLMRDFEKVEESSSCLALVFDESKKDNSFSKNVKTLSRKINQYFRTKYHFEGSSSSSNLNNNGGVSNSTGGGAVSVTAVAAAAHPSGGDSAFNMDSNTLPKSNSPSNSNQVVNGKS